MKHPLLTNPRMLLLYGLFWMLVASATALIAQTRAAMEAHPESGLHAAAEALGAVDGRTAFQAPEVDGSVYIDNPGDLKPGDFVKVKIVDGYAYDLIAERI